MLKPSMEHLGDRAVAAHPRALLPWRLYGVEALASAGTSTGTSEAPSTGTLTPGTTTPAQAAQSAANQAYGMAGEPDTSTGSGLGGFINGLLGAGL